MNKGTDMVNVERILNSYQEYCEDKGYTFKEEDYQEFVRFLEIDFFDWVKENLNQFIIQTKYNNS